MKNKLNYNSALKAYISFLKKNKLYESKKKFFYENNIEKMSNWTNVDFRKTFRWYNDIKKSNKAVVKTVHLERMKKWIYDNKKGVLKHSSGEFFHIEGKRITKSDREVKSWDQPFIKQVDYKGGIIGLVRSNIKGMPHYLVDAKFEPGNYKFIQLSPTVQATFSNIKKAHGGRTVKFLNFFKSPSKNKCKIIFKQWVSEEGGRLRNKRNLGIIIEYTGKKEISIEPDYKWLTLKQIKELILENAMINPHLRTLVSFI